MRLSNNSEACLCNPLVVRVKKKIIYEPDDWQTLRQNSGLKAERNIGDPHVFQVPLPRKELTDGLQGPMLNEEV